jgi:hypothetical protein
MPGFFSTRERTKQAGEDISTLNINYGQASAVLEYRAANHPTQTGSDTNPDDPGFSFLRVACRLHRMPGLHDELSRFVQKNLTCLGQRYAPLIAQKEGTPRSSSSWRI